MKFKLFRLPLFVSGLLLLGPVPSCARQGGGLMLEIHERGLSLTRLEVVVDSESGANLVHEDYEVISSSFPATVGVLNNVNNTNLWVQVAGYAGTSLKDARRYRVEHVPSDETRVLVIELSAKCTSLVEPEGEHGVKFLCEGTSMCDSRTGQCEDATRNADDLPVLDPGTLVGVGGAPSGVGGVGQGGDPTDSGGGSSGGKAGTGGHDPVGSGGGGLVCQESDRACTGDGLGVVSCTAGEPETTLCPDGERCSATTLACDSIEPACEGQSEGTQFCGADRLRYACGESGLTSEVVEALCPAGVPCEGPVGATECKTSCDKSHGGCDEEVSCTESLNGPVCGTCPPDMFSMDGGKTCDYLQDCPPGSFVADSGGPTEDRTCDDCDSGSFTSLENETACQLWSCPEGQVPSGPGTTSMNQPCVKLGEGQWGTSASDVVTGIASDAGENLFVVGDTSGDLLAKSMGGSDFFVMKLDPNRNFVWGLQGGTGRDDHATGVAVNAEGEVFVVGSTTGPFAGNEAQGQDGFVMKLRADGTQEWVQPITTAADDWATSVIVSGAGRVFVAGGTRGALAGQSAQGSDAFVRVVDEGTGATLYTDVIATASDDQAVGLTARYDVTQGGDGFDEVFAALELGERLATGGGGPGGGGSWGGGALERGAAVRGYMPDGTGYKINWSEQFGSGEIHPHGITYNSVTRRVHVVGSIIGQLSDPMSSTVGAKLNALGLQDGFIRSYDRDGEDAFARQFGTEADDVAYAIAIRDDGDLVVCGSTAGTFSNTQSLGGVDAFVRHYGKDGGGPVAAPFGTSGSDVCRAITMLGTTAWMGGSTTGTLPSSTAFGGLDAFLLGIVPPN